MKIIYISTVCTLKKYRELFEKSNNKPGQAVLKYHRLLIEGLSNVKNVEITAISSLPVNRNNCSRKFIKKSAENNKNVCYYYMDIINVPVIKNIVIFLETIVRLLYEIICSKSKCILICDTLYNTISIATLLVSKLLKCKCVAIVTDVPGIMLGSQKYGKLGRKIINLFNAYIFLTHAMNSLLNVNDKPYIVMEGHVDKKMYKVKKSIKEKYPFKVCMYTGAIKEIYGVKQLVEAFIACDLQNAELHLYGSGDYVKELIEVCNKNKNIKYFGEQLNEVIVEEQQKADLLINPRFTCEEYTKYSFPSKNMEYMVSGTAVLTTKLPGMPEEYQKYVYLFEDESFEGYKNKIKFVLCKSRKELYETGCLAKQFVLKEKNNIIQANKLVDMFYEII